MHGRCPKNTLQSCMMCATIPCRARTERKKNIKCATDTGGRGEQQQQRPHYTTTTPAPQHITSVSPPARYMHEPKPAHPPNARTGTEHGQTLMISELVPLPNPLRTYPTLSRGSIQGHFCNILATSWRFCGHSSDGYLSAARDPPGRI